MNPTKNDRKISPVGGFTRAMSALTVLGWMASSAQTVQAHPGHALTEATVSHVLTSPYHLAVLALLGTVAWFGARFVQRQLLRRLLQTTGATLVFVAMSVWAVRF
jgi:hypothetical protein